MADIDVERKGGMAWLWWVLGLLALLLVIALLVWPDEEPAPVAVVEPPVTEVQPTRRR